VSAWHRHRLAVLVAASLAAGCAARSGSGAEAPSAETPSVEAPSAEVTPSRPAEAESDAAYYQERAAALAREDAGELEQTDFVRLRRGRLYAPRALDEKELAALDKRLVVAAGARDHQATLELSAQILVDDQTNVHAHLSRSIALRKLGRSKEADFHFAFARQLSQSILGSGDGKSAESAYTAYSEDEQHAVLKVTGYTLQSRALEQANGRSIDVLTVRKNKGGTSTKIYFDVSESSAEEARRQAGAR
jgi:hypothetical protein